MRVKKLSAAVVAALVTAGIGAAAPSASAAVTDPTGRYQVVTPSRIVDTRTGLGLPAGPVRANTTAAFQVTGRGGVPATGVQSVVVNITVVNPAATGWLVAYASDSAQPRTSTVNYPGGWTGATSATVPVGADGKIKVSVGGSGVQVAVDVMGWYASSTSTVAPGSLYQAAVPERWFDSRTDGGGKFVPGDYLDIPIEFDETGGARLTAMQFNLTATGGTGRGWFTAWNGTNNPPSTSALNFSVGETSPNLVTVPVRRVGNSTSQPGWGEYYATVENTSNASAHLIVDGVASFYTDPSNKGATHVVVPPVRVGDSRSGVGMPKGKLGAGRTVNVALPGSLLTPRTDSFEGTITMANPSTNSFLSLFAVGDPRPVASAVNAQTGRNRSNGFATYPGCVDTACTTAGYSIYNSTGTVDAILDVTGRFDLTAEAIAAQGAPAAKATQKSGQRAQVRRAQLAGAPTRG